jgi:ribonucleoside-diphosphate reductase alpha subunit
METYVVKRDGTKEPVSFDKVLERIKILCGIGGDYFTTLHHVDYTELARKVISGIHPDVKTSDLDNLAADTAHPMVSIHPEYDVLASRIAISNYHKTNVHLLYDHFIYCLQNGLSTFTESERKGLLESRQAYISQRLCYFTFKALYENVDDKGMRSPLVAPHVFAMIKNNPELESLLQYSRDYEYDYCGFTVLKNTYLQKCHLYSSAYNRTKPIWVPIERPQHMLLRVILGIHASLEYKNFDRMRTNNTVIWEAIQVHLRPLMNKVTYHKYRRLAKHNTIDWQQLNTLLVNHKNVYNTNSVKAMCKRINELLHEHTISWEQLCETVDKSDEYPKYVDIADIVRNNYNLMSNRVFTHATPTLFNSGTLRPQNSSCYLLMIGYDSLQQDGITKFWSDVAEISKYAGGVGSHIHNIRPQGAYIRGTNGRSNGIAPLLRVMDCISSYIDQGGGKRKGAHAVYAEPWIGDIDLFSEMKRNIGADVIRARNLNYAMWMPDEFFRRLEHENSEPMWYLMDPNTCPELAECYDETLCRTWISDEDVIARKSEFRFTHKYRKYIRQGKYIARVSASDLWTKILVTIIESGEPYVFNKDSVNRKSNQKNVATTKSSNLCGEITQVSLPDEIAVCNLASICLPEMLSAESSVSKFCDSDIRPTEYQTNICYHLQYPDSKPKYRKILWETLENAVRVIVRNLNQVIDVNYYPLEETRTSNLRHRPMGIGVQGLADMYSALRLEFDGAYANKLNYYIFETIYFTALDESCELAKQHRLKKLQISEKYADSRSGSYKSYIGSPVSHGKLQYDMWLDENPKALAYPLSRDWTGLREKIKLHGIRNSLLVAPMPTGTTSTIMGNSPCFEPHNAIIYKRSNGSGEFILFNKQLVQDLTDLGLWNYKIRNKIMVDDQGSISNVREIPPFVRKIYKTVWDIDIKYQIRQMLTRAVFVDQSQSFSWFVSRPTIELLNKMYIHCWKHGAKISSYYTRGTSRTNAQKVTAKDDCGEGGFCGS